MPSRDQIVEFQVAYLKHLLAFLKSRGINSHASIAQLRATKLIEEPMWKLLEIDGKYAGNFISAGVKELSDKVGREPDGQGKWPERLLAATLGALPPEGWRRSLATTCRLDHVIDRRILNEWLLSDPDRVDEILRVGLIGCVVLGTEHQRLERLASVDIRDPWQKYRMAGIRVWSRSTGDWHPTEPSNPDT